MDRIILTLKNKTDEALNEIFTNLPYVDYIGPYFNIIPWTPYERLLLTLIFDNNKLKFLLNSPISTLNNMTRTGIQGGSNCNTKIKSNKKRKYSKKQKKQTRRRK